MAKKKVSSSAQVKEEGHMAIAPPNLPVAEFTIYGTAPYVQCKFSAKAKREIMQAQTESQGKKRGKKEPRNFDEDYGNAFHRMEDGSYGIPCSAIRNAMISACRVAGFVMTRAKLSIFALPDGFDADDGQPLIYIDGEPERNESYVRPQTDVTTIAIRPMWRVWSSTFRLKWDADQFSHQDVCNLLERAGQQVGIGEGRPDSKKSNGQGWGTFTLINPE